MSATPGQAQEDVGAGAGGAVLDLQDLALDRGGELLLRRTLRRLPPGARLAVRGRDPLLPVHLRAFCRAAGLEVAWPEQPAPVVARLTARGPDTGAEIGRASCRERV